MSNHTPGKWSKFGPFSLRDMNGIRDAWTISASNDTQLIAEIYTDANATLIETAPEMLELLKEVLLETAREFPILASSLRITIARAEGYQP